MVTAEQRIKLALKTAIATAINTWECAPKIRTGTSTFGRKSKDEKWNELCVELIRCELSKPGVDLTDLIILGPKPQMPGNWDGTPILRGLPGPAAIPNAAPSECKARQISQAGTRVEIPVFRNTSTPEEQIYSRNDGVVQRTPAFSILHRATLHNIVEKWRTSTPFRLNYK